MFTKNIKLLTLTGVLLTAGFGLTACSTPTPGYDVPYTDETFSVMSDDIEKVVCGVAGQTVMTEQNVEDFRALSDRVSAYEGAKTKQATMVASTLENLADDWEVSLGTDLGVENAAELDSLCDSIGQAKQ